MNIARLLCLAVLCLGFSIQAQNGWKCYYGDLHTHCAASDGQGTPQQAYAYARDTAKDDFLALTDHNHLTTQEQLEQVYAAAANEQRPAFQPLYGQEFSTLADGNHVNVFNIVENIPASLNNDFKALYGEWLPNYQQRHPAEIILCQFNHPASVTKDYGICSVRKGRIRNYCDNWDNFVAEADRWVKLIALVNGPAGKGQTQHDLHMDIKKQKVDAWFTYLDKGFHLAPTCNQDTHVKSWGDLSTARTGVWLNKALSNQALLEGLKAGHCFATEDKNLRVWFELDGQVMGSRLPDMGAKDLALTVTVADEDEPQSRYQVEIYHDVVGDGALAKPLAKKYEVACGGTVTATVTHQKDVCEFYLVHVKQQGIDDDAWTAPIYIGPGKLTEEDTEEDVPLIEQDVKFVGSQNSSVYHYPSCKAVAKIKTGNLAKYKEAPEGKRLHKNCPVE